MSQSSSSGNTLRLAFFFLFFPLRLFAQDITGNWTGFIQTEGNKLVYELTINGTPENPTGYAMTIFDINGRENMGIKSVIIKNKKGNVSLEDDELIYDNYTTSPRRMKLFAKLSLNISGTNMILSGNFYTRSLDFRSNGVSYTGFITLKKQSNETRTRLMAEMDSMTVVKTVRPEEPMVQVPEPKKTLSPKNITPKKIDSPQTVKPLPDQIIKPVKKIDSPQAIKPTPEQVVKAPKVEKTDTAQTLKPPPVAAPRRTQVIRTVSFQADSIRLTLYDNGTVDGDTVSILLNGVRILENKRLSTTPVRTAVSTIGVGDSLMLVMFAENLGSIPPNTGLLIIEEGANRYEIRFEGDLQTSSAIILKRRK